MSKLSGVELFLSKFNKVTNNKILVSEYLGREKLIIIKDAISGLYYKMSPRNALRNRFLIESAIDKTLYFINQLKLINPNLVVESKYINQNTYIIVSDLLNIKYFCRPVNLLKGKKSTILSAIDKQDAFIKKANYIHNNKYTYNLENFSNFKSIISINCPIHGIFKQTVDRHISGNSCPLCNRLGIMSSVYKYHPNKITYLYYMQLENDEGIFYKIGLTTIHPNKRLQNFNNLKSKKVIDYIKGTIKELYHLEQEYHQIFNLWKINYMPKELIGNGATECFKW